MTEQREEELPELRSGLLSDSEVEALFRDYAECAEAVQVLVKRRHRNADSGESVPLDEAQSLLRSAQAVAVQVRYLHGGCGYVDTLLRKGPDVTLIRMVAS